MNNKDRLAGLVVIYNPSTEVKGNIDSYIDDVDRLYIVDNTESASSNDFFSIIDRLKENSKVIYKGFGCNKGLAIAIDYGCRLAIRDGYEYLITFDQDSIMTEGTIAKMVNSLCNNANYGMAAPNLKRLYRKNNTRVFTDEIVYPQKDEIVAWSITSGSMFRLKDYESNGGIDTMLFIGQIDQDYCCKVNNITHKEIIRFGNVYMYQELGDTTKRRILMRTVHVPNYSSTRWYYVFRNEMYLRKKWGKLWKDYQAKLWQDIVLIILFEKDKFIKIKKAVAGIRDGVRMVNT